MAEIPWEESNLNPRNWRPGLSGIFGRGPGVFGLPNRATEDFMPGRRLPAGYAEQKDAQIRAYDLARLQREQGAAAESEQARLARVAALEKSQQAQAGVEGELEFRETMARDPAVIDDPRLLDRGGELYSLLQQPTVDEISMAVIDEAAREEAAGLEDTRLFEASRVSSPGVGELATVQDILVDPTRAYKTSLADIHTAEGIAAQNLREATEGTQGQLADKQRAIGDAHAREALRIGRQTANIKKAEELRYETLHRSRREYTIGTEKIRDFTIDPQRMFKHGWAAFGAAIAVALGSAAESLGGGTNTALQILDAAVQRDIDAQKLEFEGLKFGVQAKQTAYQMAMDQVGDERAADNLIFAQEYEAFKARLEAVSASYDSQILQSNTKALIAQLDQKQAQRQADRAQQLWTVEFGKWQVDTQNQNAIYTAAMAYADKNKFKGFDKDQRARMIGARGFLTKLKMLQELKEDVRGASGFLGGMVPRFMHETKASRFNNLITGLVADYTKIMSGAAASEAEAERLRSQFPSAASAQEIIEFQLDFWAQKVQGEIGSLYETFTPAQQQRFNTGLRDDIFSGWGSTGATDTSSLSTMTPR